MIAHDPSEAKSPRLLRSLLRYVGGKSRLAHAIIKRIPAHRAYVEPFAGGAWVFFGKSPSKVEVLNDQDGELINFWRVAQNHPDELLRWCERLLPSRELFASQRQACLEQLTDVQRAARYFYLQRLAFGGQMKHLNFGVSAIKPPGFDMEAFRQRLPQIQARLQRVLIERQDAVECLKKYDRKTTFFYLDPPYWGEQKYRLNFGLADYQRLADALKKLNGSFLMTLNDCEPIRRIFAGFTFETVQSGYFIANSRGAKNARPRRGQLLIHNLA